MLKVAKFCPGSLPEVRVEAEGDYREPNINLQLYKKNHAGYAQKNA